MKAHFDRRRPHAPAAVMGLALVAAGQAAHGQSTFEYNGGTYTQNFITLPSLGSFTFSGAGPHDLAGLPVGAFGMPGWQIGKMGADAGTVGFFSSTGSSTTGGLYSYGPGASLDRALGSLASGSVAPVFGAVLVNRTGATLTQFTLSYTGEQWRRGNGTMANTLEFSYATGATGILDAGAVFTSVPSLGFASPNMGSAGATDGNANPNRTAVSFTVDGLSWAPDASLVFRWSDPDEGGNDDGLAIDDLSFFAIGGPRNLVWNPSGAGGNTWSTHPANTNWLLGGNPVAFANGDIARFTDAGVGSVNVASAGLAPAEVHVSHAAGAYRFVGEPISGGPLFKTEAGRLELTALRNAGLNVAGGEVQMLPGASAAMPERASDVGSLVIAGGPAAPTARLDLSNNILIVGSTAVADSGGGGPEDTAGDIRLYLQAGYNGGPWDGNGIVTTSGDASHFGLGYATQEQLDEDEYAGIPIEAGDVVVRFTRFGDANLDGIVGLVDFNRLAASFGAPADATWFRGDFTYDGLVNLTDFNRLAANFGLAAGVDGPTPADWAHLAAAVPEPGGVIPILAGAAAAGRGHCRRRRRRTAGQP